MKKIKKQIGMKTKELTKKGLVMLTMMFALVMNAEG